MRKTQCKYQSCVQLWSLLIHKRRKLLQQMRGDIALLTQEDGGSPIQKPTTAAEDARLASLISLDGILKQIKDIMRQSSVSALSKSKRKALLASLDELMERMPSLLDIDHPCAQRQIADARRVIEAIPEEDDHLQETSVLENMSLEEINQVFSQLPGALSLLSLARTADGTRACYSRLYKTLAMKVPSLRDLVGELEKGGVLKDVRS